MKYSKCNACGYIFENAKLDPDEEMAEPTCPNCRSNDFNGTAVNELNIILYY
jgi:rubredoxin